jgi:hypothetical protein
VAATVIVLAVVAVVAFIVWGFRTRHPESAAGHSTNDPTTSTELFSEVYDRPAGPGAEADGVAGPGQIVPGPSAESPTSMRRPSDLDRFDT